MTKIMSFLRKQESRKLNTKWIPHQVRDDNGQGGYIALMSAIILSLILVGLTFTVSASGFYTRFNVLDGEYKRISLGLAESCSNTALLEIGKNPNYLGNQIHIPVGVDACDIKSVSYNPISGYDVNHQKIATIATQANYHGAFSNMTVTAKVQDPNVVQIVPTTLTLTVVVPQFKPGDSLSDFHLSVSGFGAVASSQQVTATAGQSYAVSVTSTPVGYTTSGWAGDCNGSAASGNTNQPLSSGSNNSCFIYYTIQPTTATLTIFANIVPSGPVSTITIKNNSTGISQTVTSGELNQVLGGVSYTVSATTPNGYQSSKWDNTVCNKDTGVTGNLATGTSYACVINFTQPNLTCADTVMMLDRTGSMFGDNGPYWNNHPEWATAEGVAAKALLDLYSTVSPFPKVGVGSMGGLYPDHSSPAWVPDGSHSMPTGWLTNVYGSNSPAATSAGPQASTASVAPNQWTNPNNAWANDTAFAADSTNGHQQAYGNFGFNIPSGATITGIEAVVDGKVSSSPQNSTVSPNAVGNYNPPTQWSTNTGSTSNTNKINAVSDASDSTYITTNVNGSAQTFKLNTSSIPAGSTINSVTLSVRAEKSGSGSPTFSLRAEKGAGVSDLFDYTPAGSLGTSFAVYSSLTWINDPVTNSNWGTVSNLSSWGFGIVKTSSSGTIRVSQIYVVVNYTPPTSGTIGVNLSYDSGTNWTTVTRTASLNGTEAAVIPSGNSPGDLWGFSPSHTWVAGDFADGKFVLRLTNNSVAGITAMVNYLTVKIYYTMPATGLYYAINTMMANNSVGAGSNLSTDVSVGNAELLSTRHTAGLQKVLILVSDGVPDQPTGYLSTDQTYARNAATAAKTSGSQIYAMHFGDSAGIPLLQQLVSLSTFPASTIVANGAKRIGTQVTITTASAHPLAVDQYVQVAGLTSSLNGTFVVTSIPSPTTFTYTTTSSGTVTSGGGTATPTNLFEAPTSSQMQDVFRSIGQQVCPAVAAASQATLNLSTHVINNNGNTGVAGDFHITITGASPNPGSFDGSETGTPVIVTPSTSFNISVANTKGNTNYYSPQFVGCSASGNTISAGQTIYCSIIYYDMPPAPSAPPPPPPPSDINIGSWQENP